MRRAGTHFGFAGRGRAGLQLAVAVRVHARRSVGALLLPALFACGGDASPCDKNAVGPGCPGEVVGVRFQPAGSIVLLGAGATQALNVAAVRRDSSFAAIATVSWTTQGGTTVARVDGTGTSVNVVAVARGATTITATVVTAQQQTLSATVPVTTRDVERVTISPAADSLELGRTLQLNASVQADAGIATSVRWSSSNASVASVSATGLVTATAEGTANIVATSVNPAVAAAVTVKVVRPRAPVARVALVLEPACVNVGARSHVRVTAYDGADATLAGRTATVTSLAPAIASYNSATGDATGVSVGRADIQATVEGISSTQSLRVTNGVANVAVRVAAAGLRVGETTQAVADVSDCSGAVLVGRSVSWSASPAGIVSVSPTGLVTAVAVGSATVTATVDGVTGGIAVGVTGVIAARLTLLSASQVGGVVLTPVTPAIRVRADDAAGGPAANAEVRFSIKSGRGTIRSGTTTDSAVSVVTDALGIASGTWTLGDVEGTQVLELSLPANSAATRPRVIATAADPVTLLEAAPGSLAQQGGTIFATVATVPAARLTKASGRPAIGYSVSFAASGNGRLSPSGVPLTDASGIARLSSWTLGGTLGDQTVTAEAPSLIGANVVFHALAGPPTVSLATPGTPNRARTAYAVTAHVTDGTGKAIEGAPVDFAAASNSAPGSSFNPTSVSTNASGDAVSMWTLGPSLAAYSAEAKVGATQPSLLTATAVLPSVTEGIVRGTVVQLGRDGSQTPIAGVTVTINRLTISYNTPPTSAIGAYESPPLTGGQYSFTVPLVAGKIREVRYSVAPVLGDITTIGPIRYTPGGTSGPIEFLLVGSRATDPGATLEVWEGIGGDGTEAGRPSISVTRVGTTGTWGTSTFEGFFRVKVTLPGLSNPIFSDCIFNDDLQNGPAPVCTINVP